MRGEIHGAAELARALNAPIDRAMQPIAVAVAAELQNILAPYPPARAGSRYVRGRGSPPRYNQSEQMGRKWLITPFGTGAKLTNQASYSAYVQSAERQASIHVGRWTTDERASERLTQSGQILAIVTDALKAQLGGILEA